MQKLKQTNKQSKEQTKSLLPRLRQKYSTICFELWFSSNVAKLLHEKAQKLRINTVYEHKIALVFTDFSQCQF